MTLNCDADNVQSYRFVRVVVETKGMPTASGVLLGRSDNPLSVVVNDVFSVVLTFNRLYCINSSGFDSL
jgi:hypothetical protein